MGLLLGAALIYAAYKIYLDKKESSETDSSDEDSKSD
jgi:hypothetical protein